MTDEAQAEIILPGETLFKIMERFKASCEVGQGMLRPWRMLRLSQAEGFQTPSRFRPITFADILRARAHGVVSRSARRVVVSMY
jgi:hypothetical protein